MPYNDDMVKDYLDKFGVKHSQLGYKYLVSAFTVISEEPDKKTTLCEVYEKIAERYRSEPKCVAKAIGYAIKHNGISNKEFIFRAIDRDFIAPDQRENRMTRRQTGFRQVHFESLTDNSIMNEEGHVYARESKKEL